MKRNNIFRRTFAFVLKDSELLLSFHNAILRFLNKKRFQKEVDKRKNIPLFAASELAKEIFFCPIERIKDSNFYGYADAIKKYSNSKRFDYALEHGLYFDDYVAKAAYLKTTHQVMTFNRSRESLLKNMLQKNAIAIGPYIHYAEPLLSESEMRKLKQQLGKTLLLFPLHSDVEDDAIYDSKKLVADIKDFATFHGFKTVLVSMFYRDLQCNEYARVFSDAGFKIVTAGHRYDLNFIRRQKSIIMLADYTISNTVGTHLGYCVYLKKPHFIIDRDAVLESTYNMWREIGLPFTIYSECLTKEQCDVVSKYWGFECIKTPEEMYKILNSN